MHPLADGDVVVGRGRCIEVPGADLSVTEGLDLAVARQQPGAVGAQLPVLVDDAELDWNRRSASEP